MRRRHQQPVRSRREFHPKRIHVRDTDPHLDQHCTISVRCHHSKEPNRKQTCSISAFSGKRCIATLRSTAR